MMDGKWNAGLPGINKEECINVVMEEQSHRFALNGSVPVSGRLHISDGNLNFTGKNMKPVTVGYKLFLIGRKGGSSIYKIMGDIVPDIQGTAELQVNINPEDIDGEGADLSCFYIFMVAAMGKPLQPVLKGDLAEWQSAVRTEYSEPGSGRLGTSTKQHRSYNSFYMEYILLKIAMLLNETASKTDISPFDDVWLTSDWKRVTDASQFPVASVGAEQQIREYGHFIFGCTVEHFYLGVPGRHTENEWPDNGKSGFMMWQSIRGSDEYGYWMMVIDRKTGIITEIS